MTYSQPSSFAGFNELGEHLLLMVLGDESIVEFIFEQRVLRKEAKWLLKFHCEKDL